MLYHESNSEATFECTAKGSRRKNHISVECIILVLTTKGLSLGTFPVGSRLVKSKSRRSRQRRESLQMEGLGGAIQTQPLRTALEASSDSEDAQRSENHFRTRGGGI